MTKTLLVVDDALIIREIVKETAIDAGWEIAGEATNGQEAIEQYLKLKPTAVTLDTGNARIRRHPRTARDY